MPEHDDDCGCFKCKIRSISFGQVPGASRSARILKESEMPKHDPAANAWERGTAKINGVPLVDERLRPIPIKEFTENRHSIKDRLAAVKAAGSTKE